MRREKLSYFFVVQEISVNRHQQEYPEARGKGSSFISIFFMRSPLKSDNTHNY